jgi:hypothetical protein
MEAIHWMRIAWTAGTGVSNFIPFELIEVRDLL